MGSLGPRVVVTDLGLVTAAGIGVDAAWSCIEEGRSCIGDIRTFDGRAFPPSALGAELIELPEAERDDDERSLRLLLGAARTLTTGLPEHLERHRDDARRTAVVLGTSKGAVLGMASVHRRFAEGVDRLSAADAEAVRRYRPGYGAARLAELIGARGPRTMVGQACASSSMAILHAVELIRAGVIDRAVAGGFDGFSPFIYTGFHVIGALSRTGCRPFDIGRDGTVLGEGAALLVLESEEAAEARSARPLAIFEGGGFASDGVHLTAPDREGRGLVRAIGQALDDAEIDAEEVGYINAHGTATSFNDAMECTAFRQIFDGRGAMRPISSIKSIFGHTLGAAGALDAIVSIEALNRQILPPTVNGAKEPLVEEWDFVTEGARPVSDLEVVLTTNSGFAGNNTALIFRRVDPCPDELCPPCRERRAAETTSHDGIAP